MPERFSVIFLALVPGHEGTQRVRFYSESVRQNVQIKPVQVELEGVRVETLEVVLTGHIIWQRATEGVIGDWRPFGEAIYKMLKAAKFELSCVLGQRGRSTWPLFRRAVCPTMLVAACFVLTVRSLKTSKIVPHWLYWHHRCRTKCPHPLTGLLCAYRHTRLN
jgi:hypothetical protein